MGNLVYLTQIVELAQEKATRENKPVGDVLKEIIESLKEKI